MAPEINHQREMSGRALSKASVRAEQPFSFLARKASQPMCFLWVGGIGLFVDLAVFTAIPAHVDHPFFVRLGALVVATLVTWWLNRLLTFHASGRPKHAEAARYVVVTVLAQGTSYAIFAILTFCVFTSLPQAATVVGAAVGAIVSYNGYRLFAFAPISSVREPSLYSTADSRQR